MKTTYIIAALSGKLSQVANLARRYRVDFVLTRRLVAICAVEATSMSTITCSACPPATTANDMVTRSDEPTTPCTAPSLTVIPNPGASTDIGTGGMPTSTGAPVVPTEVPIAAGSRMAGSVGAAIALGAAAVYMM